MKKEVGNNGGGLAGVSLEVNLGEEIPYLHQSIIPINALLVRIKRNIAVFFVLYPASP